MTAVLENNEDTATTETVTVFGLVPMMRDLALFTARDKTLPMLDYVQLYMVDGRAHGWATNRFIMGHAVADGEGDLSVFMVHFKDAENIAKTFKTSPLPYLTVTRDGDKMTVTDGGNSITFQGGDVEHPPMAKLIDETPESPGGDPVEFDPAWMEKPVKVAKARKEGVRLQTGSTTAKATHWQVGGYFRALVMPRRYQGETTWLANS